jgi:hypothetical protein
LGWRTGVVDEVVLVQVWMSRKRCEHSRTEIQEMRLGMDARMVVDSSVDEGGFG